MEIGLSNLISDLAILAIKNVSLSMISDLNFGYLTFFCLGSRQVIILIFAFFLHFIVSLKYALFISLKTLFFIIILSFLT